MGLFIFIILSGLFWYWMWSILREGKSDCKLAGLIMSVIPDSTEVGMTIQQLTVNVNQKANYDKDSLSCFNEERVTEAIDAFVKNGKIEAVPFSESEKFSSVEAPIVVYRKKGRMEAYSYLPKENIELLESLGITIRYYDRIPSFSIHTKSGEKLWCEVPKMLCSDLPEREIILAHVATAVSLIIQAGIISSEMKGSSQGANAALILENITAKLALEVLPNIDNLSINKEPKNVLVEHEI